MQQPVIIHKMCSLDLLYKSCIPKWALHLQSAHWPTDHMWTLKLWQSSWALHYVITCTHNSFALSEKILYAHSHLFVENTSCIYYVWTQFKNSKQWIYSMVLQGLVKPQGALKSIVKVCKMKRPHIASWKTCIVKWIKPKWNHDDTYCEASTAWKRPVFNNTENTNHFLRTTDTLCINLKSFEKNKVIQYETIHLSISHLNNDWPGSSLCFY